MLEVKMNSYTEIKQIFSNNASFPLIFNNKEEKQKWLKKIKETPSIQPLLLEIKDEASRLLHERDQELTFTLFQLFEKTGSRLEYEKVYFSKRRRLNTFAIMSLLEPENQNYLSELENTIWSILNEYSWCLPAHLTNSAETATEFATSLTKHEEAVNYTIDLFAAETAFALSEIYTIGKESLSPLIVKRIHSEICKRIFRPFLASKQGWETATHNWAAVCAGSLGSAALHLLHEEAELSEIMTRVLKTMEYYLQGFHDDGTCLEGYGYWQYGFGFYVYFADLLKKRTLGKIDLFCSQKVHQIALFQQRSFLYKNKVVNFSDAQREASVFLGLSHYLHHVFHDIQVPEQQLRASYTEDHCSRWAPAFRNLLWFDDKLEGKPWKSETNYFNESQWLISRHKANNDFFAFAAKGGNNHEPHNHNDLGQFILQKNHEAFLKDLGSGMYCKDYFGEKRYTFICNGSHGHSVPLINNQGQGAGSTYYTKVVNVQLAEEIDRFELDLTKAYERSILNTYHRMFVWKKSALPTLTLEDIFHFDKMPESVVERFIIPNIQTIEQENGILLKGKEALQINYDKEQLDVTVETFTILDHFGVKQMNQFLDFRVRSIEKHLNIKLEFQFM